MPGEDQNLDQINSLEEALKLHNQNQSASAQTNMGDNTVGGQPGEMDAEVQQASGNPEQQFGGDGTTPPEANSLRMEDGSGGSLGGSAASIPDTSVPSNPQPTVPQAQTYGQPAPAPASDIQDVRQNLIKNIQQEAIRNVTKQFQDKGIQKYNIGMLYDKDSTTGNVTFFNPDNERQPFQTRSEAQTWIDSMNGQIDNEFRNMVMQEQRRLLETNQPRLRLLEFVPTYNTMNEQERAVFEDLIEPYAISDNGGVIGFNCDLNTAYQQTKAICSRFATPQQPQQTNPQGQQQPAQPGTTPALDTNTSATGQQVDAAPKNLNEAMKRVNASNKKKGK